MPANNQKYLFIAIINFSYFTVQFTIGTGFGENIATRPKYNVYRSDVLKEQCHEIFDLRFLFIKQSPLGPRFMG
jgi:hypothetical protein